MRPEEEEEPLMLRRDLDEAVVEAVEVVVEVIVGLQFRLLLWSNVRRRNRTATLEKFICKEKNCR